MSRIGRMILMTSAQNRSRRDSGRYGRNEYDGGDYSRNEYGGGRGDYGRSEYDGPDSRFRDRRGREHYDNGRFAPQNYGGGMEGRYWDDREAYRPMESHYSTPYAPPVYWDYGERGGRPMNTIGFRMSGDQDQRPGEFSREYRTNAGHHGMDEMAYRQGDGRMSGHGSGSGDIPFTRELAQEWVHGMKNADGTTGPHWTMEKTEEARAQRGINCDSLAWWVAMNMVYSDYAKVAEKINANSMDFYAYMAKAFLEDKDARNQGAEKLARYYEYVVM